MKIPNGPSGNPTVSISQLRTYGGGGFALADQEEAKGCPRLYKAKYVERRVTDEHRSYPLRYGSYVHDVFFRMEQEGMDPDEALVQCLPADATPEWLREARADLNGYMERGASPMDMYGTLQVETELDAVLYVDEDHGPVHFRGILDWLGVDLDDPTVLHGSDYKTNRQPPTVEQVAGDVQLKGYDWLIRQHMHKWGGRSVVMHLDAIKWREIPMRYSDAEIEEWHAWAVALVRKMLRDDTAKPRINAGCDWCPVKMDCPEYAKVPETARLLGLEIKAADGKSPKVMTPEEMLDWRDRANAMRLLLEKGVKAIDLKIKGDALETGRVVIGKTEWVAEPNWKDEVNLRLLHRAMGDTFYDVASVAKGNVQSATQDWSPDRLAAVNAAFTRTIDGQKVKRGKVEEE